MRYGGVEVGGTTGVGVMRDRTDGGGDVGIGEVELLARWSVWGDGRI